MRPTALAAGLSLLLWSCESPVMPLPGTTGKAGEVVIVMDDRYWDSTSGDAVSNALTAEIYGLPQPEPMFDAVHIRTEAFSKIFQTHRNILLVNINKDLGQSIEVRYDVWSSPQIVIEITAPDEARFLDIFNANADRVTGNFLKKEEERNRNSYSKQLQDEVVRELSTSMGIRLPVPKGFNVIAKADDFIWVRYDTRDINQSILIYTEPYTRQNTFSQEGMIEVMNSFMRKHVPGPTSGSYMKIFVEYPPLWRETSVGGLYASELRGLWNVEGDIMGGPFVCYAMLDEPRNRVIYLHGFIFAPALEKRNLVWQLQSMLKGTELL
jgi:hypothetical protein